MILAVDINNTNVVFSLMSDGKPLFISTLSSSKLRTEDEYAVLMDWTAKEKGFDLKQADGAIMASVVPPLTAVIGEAIQITSGCKPLIVGPGLKTGLNIRLEDPAELGGDFVASAVAAISDYPLPCVVVEMGTATAMGILDSSGGYIGGVICPGISVSQEALASGAAQLSNVSISPPPQTICKSTDACMRSGLTHGCAAMVDGLLVRIEEELGAAPTVVITGRWAETIAPLCKHPNLIVDGDLIMRGLWIIYMKNKRT